MKGAYVSQMPEPTVRLTEEQISFYHNQGYLAIDHMTTPEEVAYLRKAYDRIFEQRVGHDVGDEFDLVGGDTDGPRKLPQIVEPRNYAPEFQNTLYEANAIVIAGQLLGDGMVQRGSHAIFKPAHYGAHTPWHQDAAYWNPAKPYHSSLSIWMPLQDATLENGCMQFMPKSQKMDILPHHHIGHDPKVIGLEVDDGQADFSNAVACPVPAGGATFHGGHMLHYAGPNHSDVPRRAYILMFGVRMPLAEQ